MIEELNEKEIDQIMDIWLKENKRTHIYIPEEYWDNHFEEVKKEILKAEIYVYYTDLSGSARCAALSSEKSALLHWQK